MPTEEEEQYSEEINKELSTQVAEIYTGIINRNPLPEEKELLSFFLQYAFDDDDCMDDLNMLNKIADYAMVRPRDKGEKEEFELLKFSYDMFRLFNSEYSEERQFHMESCIDRIRDIIKPFSRMEKEDLEGRIYLYEEIVNTWMTGASFKPLKRYDSMSDKEKRRIYGLIRIIADSSRKKDPDAEIHLTHLQKVLDRVSFNKDIPGYR